MQRADRERGLTIVEMAVSILLLSVTAGIITLSFGTSYSAWRGTTTSRELDRKANRGLGRVLEALEYVEFETLEPDLLPDETSPYITFRRSIGFANDEKVWGPTERVEWLQAPEDPADGVDNNGNGLVDEGIIVHTFDPGGADERSAILVRGVSNMFKGEAKNDKDDNGNGLVDEKGLSFDVDGGILNVRVTMLGPCKDGSVKRWVGEAAVALRGGP